MSDDKKRSTGKKEPMKAGTKPQLREGIEEALVTIEVSPANRVSVWSQIIDNDLVGRYLGKNRFAFEPNQLDYLHSAGIQFEVR